MGNNISFGLVDDYSLQFGTANIRSIFHINKRQQIAITSKDVIKFERDQIVKRFNFSYFIGCYIEKYDMMACIAQQKSALTIYMLKDTSYPLLSLFPLDQTGIFHIFYSPKSSSLITIGSGVKVWNCHVEIPSSPVLDPKVTITFRSQFLFNNYESNLLNLPTFDYDKEILYLPTNFGIKGFDLNGNQVKSLSRLPAKNTTPIAFCQSNGKILACDPRGGLCLFGKNGDLISHYEIGISNLISINFVDSENAILLNCNGSVYILNLKTSKFFHVYTAYAIPNRVYIQLNTAEIDPILVLVYQTRVTYTRIIIPWQLWAKSVIFPKLIRRFNRINEPGRIVVQTNNSFVKIFSPRTGTLLTSASSSTSASPVYVTYDRGTFVSTIDDYKETKYQFCETDKRDELFIVMDNGYVHGFDTGFSPCNEILKVDIKASAIVACREITNEGSKWMYAAARNGEAYFCDYNTFRVRRKIVTGNMKFVNMFYNDQYNCIVLLFEDECALLNIEKKSVVERVKCRGSSISFMNGDYVYIGLPTGQINIIKVVDSFHLQINENLSSQIIHSDAVTSFAFSPSFWISVGLDGCVFIWDYSFSLIGKIKLPEPLYACEIINGYRDILLGTCSELMIIKGKTFWDDAIDNEIELIDNFDTKEDQLYSSIFTKMDEEEDEPEDTLLGNRNKENKQNEDMQNKVVDKLNKALDQIDEEEERKKIENALNGMSLLNNGRPQPPPPQAKPEEVVTEEEEIKEVEKKEETEKKKKKKRRKKKDNGDEYESEYESENENDNNLDDLLPFEKVKEEPKPEEPKIPARVKQEWKDKPKKERPARPNRNEKPAENKTKLKKNAQKQDFDDVESSEQDEISDSDIVLKMEKEKENETDEQVKSQKENTTNEEEIGLKMENTSKEDQVEQMQSENHLKQNKVDQDTQSEVKKEKGKNNELIKTPKRIKEPPTQSTKNARLVNKSTQGSAGKEKPKNSIINIPQKETEKEKGKEKPKDGNSKQKRNKASTSMQVKKEKYPNPKPEKKEKPKTSLKKVKQSPPKTPKTPRPQPIPKIKQRKRTPSPIRSTMSDHLLNQRQQQQKIIESTTPKFDKSEIIKDRNRKNFLPPINSSMMNTTQSHYLAIPKNYDKEQEQFELQFKERTHNYLLNMDDLPLSIVTNLDDPEWHIEMAHNTDQYESIWDGPNQSFDTIKPQNDLRCQTAITRVNESNDFDKLAQAIERKCPKIIQSKPAHWLLSQSLPSDAAILPGAAWRRTAIGSRLIKSTRPKVYRPAGKIEKSLTIKSPTTPRRLNTTPLHCLRQKCEAHAED